MSDTFSCLHLHLDPLGGIAGDMFLAALLDAFPEHVEGTIAAMRAAGLPGSFAVELVEAREHGLAGRRLVVRAGEGGAPAGAYPAIRERLAQSVLEPGARARALAILDLLGEAEAAVHGVALEDVHFHELAGWDSIADIAGAAHLIEALQPSSWSLGPLPMGRGRIDSAHGPLPVPAPATARLLLGFELIDDGFSGERVTPTGAAILRHLQPARQAPAAPARLARSGNGLGMRRLEGIANVLRVLAFEPLDGPRAGVVDLIAFEVDDQTPEDLAKGLEVIRALDGVLDAVQMPAFGKKGRMAIHVQVLCRPERREAVVAACFAETATIGLRIQRVERAELPREQVTVEAEGAAVRVKLAGRPGGLDAKAEAEDLAGDRRARERQRRMAERAALERAKPPGQAR